MAKTGSSNAYLHSKRNGLLNEALELMVGTQGTWAGEVEGEGALLSLPGAPALSPRSPSLNPENNMFLNFPQVAAPLTFLSRGFVKPALDQGPPPQRSACSMLALKFDSPLPWRSDRDGERKSHQLHAQSLFFSD